MKIIKEPTVFATFEVECYCTARLEVEFSDLRRFNHHATSQMDDSYDYLFVNCPCCLKKMQLDKKLIPEWLYDKVVIER